MTELGAIPQLAFNTVGRALIAAHYKLELARFRALVERHPGPRAEIEAPAEPAAPRAFPIDDG